MTIHSFIYLYIYLYIWSGTIYRRRVIFCVIAGQ